MNQKPFLQKKKNKKIFFLLALPRSGNTLLASIINQNPDMVVTANSIVVDIVKQIYSLKEIDTFKNFPDHQSLNNVLKNVYENYYENWNYKYIIDRHPVMTKDNLFLLNQSFNKPIKCIILWRDLMDVLASYIKWFENEPTAFPNKMGNTIEEKLLKLMSTNNAIGRSLNAIQNALLPENKHMCHFIRYENLVLNTENTVRSIYKFLEIEYYPHRYHSLDQVVINNLKYDDTIVGNNMHTIKTEIKLENNEYKKLIPESIIKKYGHIKL